MNETTVPYIVFEGEQARNERHIKRLWVSLIIAIILGLAGTVISNVLWLRAWTAYDYSSEDIEVKSDNGTANFIGRDGDITNGKYSSETENPNT